MQATRHDPIDPLLFRKVMGNFASGVTVVTTAVDGEVHGITVSAFISVSLTPPLVLVSVDKGARIHGLLPQVGRYAVSMLAEDQKPISQHFAGHLQEGLKIAFVWRDGLPLIENALGHLVCDISATHPAGDHTLYVGQVVYLDYQSNRAPLLFYGGQYRSLDDRIRDHEFWWW
jgi:flavin reductase (DIM6/NTAB) family NADH-FMN oxidoreductase RutF